MIFSFIATAVITFLAIVVGYFTRSLPETLLNRVDFLVLEQAEAAGRRIAKCLGWRTPSTAHGPASAAMGAKETNARKNRSDALRAFILTLSDQQLVTGLAMMIAGFSKYCSISMYHFNIVASLAWFSSTTHLSTLAVLRDYLISHPTIRTWRVFGMFIMLCFLFAAVLVSWSSEDVGESVRCAFAHISQPSGGPDFFATIIILIYLASAYGNKFVALSTTGSNLSMGSWFAEKVRQKFGCEPRIRDDEKLIRYAASSKYPSRDIPFRYIYLTILLLPELEESFCWQILLLVFGNVYGIGSISVNRWFFTPSGGVVGSENAMGFGQYVALLLLILPLLAAKEAYDGQFSRILWVVTRLTQPKLTDARRQSSQKLLDSNGLCESQREDEPLLSQFLRNRRVDTEAGGRTTPSRVSIRRAFTMPPRPEGLQETFVLCETLNNAEAVLPASDLTMSYVANDLYSHSPVRKALAALITLCFVLFVYIALVLAGIIGYVVDLSWEGYWLSFVPAIVVMLYPLGKVALFLWEAFGWMKAYRRQTRS